MYQNVKKLLESLCLLIYIWYTLICTSSFKWITLQSPHTRTLWSTSGQCCSLHSPSDDWQVIGDPRNETSWLLIDNFTCTPSYGLGGTWIKALTDCIIGIAAIDRRISETWWWVPRFLDQSADTSYGRRIVRTLDKLYGDKLNGLIQGGQTHYQVSQATWL